MFRVVAFAVFFGTAVGYQFSQNEVANGKTVDRLPEGFLCGEDAKTEPPVKGRNCIKNPWGSMLECPNSWQNCQMRDADGCCVSCMEGICKIDPEKSANAYKKTHDGLYFCDKDAEKEQEHSKHCINQWGTKLECRDTMIGQRCQKRDLFGCCKSCEMGACEQEAPKPSKWVVKGLKEDK